MITRGSTAPQSGDQRRILALTQETMPVDASEFTPLERSVLDRCREGLTADCRAADGSPGDIRSTALASILRLVPQTSRLRLSHATVHGRLDLSDRTLPVSIEIEDSSLLDGMGLEQATIEGSLNLVRCEIGPVDGSDLVIRKALEVGFCRVHGEMNLQGMRVGAQAVFEGTHISPENAKDDGTDQGNGDNGDDAASFALTLDGARIRGDLFLDDGFTAVGQTRLVGAHVGGDVYLEKSALDGGPGDALFGDRMEVGGGIYARLGCTVSGGFSLRWAKVEGPIDFEAIAAGEHGRASIDLTGSTSRALIWKLVTTGPIALTLERFTTGQLSDDEASWTVVEDLTLEGFRYETIDSHSPRSVGSRLRWLERATSFEPSSYEHLRQLYMTWGEELDATQVAIAAERRRAAAKRGVGRATHRLWGAVSGYGLRPARTIAILAALIVVAVLIFDPQSMRLTDTTSLVQYNRLAYAVDALVPMVDLGQYDNWGPVPGWREAAVWVSVGLGWLTALALAGAATKAVTRI